MQARKLILRTSKFLGKAMLALLFLLFIVIALIHLPPAQKLITGKVTSYLSTKLEAQVEIQRIHFSILGHLAIDGITLWDTTHTKLFSAEEIEVRSSIYNLIIGEFLFDQVRISGAEGKLKQDEHGLNIQFILDAFAPSEKQPVTTLNPTTLQFKNITLENIVFEFTSTVSGVSVDVNLGKLTSREAEFSTYPTRISVDQIILQQTTVNTLSTLPEHNQDTVQTITSSDHTLLIPDFGTDIILEIKELQFKDNVVAYHREEILDTKKFDPSHISLKKLQLTISDLSIHKDSSSATLNSLSGQLPGFSLTDARADIKINRSELALSDLHLLAGNNELQADVSTPNDLQAAKESIHDQVKISLQGQFTPKDFAYFFNDSIMNQVNHWGLTRLRAQGQYALNHGELKTLELKTENSQIFAEGILKNVWETPAFSWEDFAIRASVGSDFKRTLAYYLNGITIPAGLTLLLQSSGNAQSIKADGKVASAWGNVKVNGMVAFSSEHTQINGSIQGERVDLGKWMNQPSFGPMNVSATARGMVGTDQDIQVNGLINHAIIMEQPIHDIAFQTRTKKDSASVTILINDPQYRAKLNSEISFIGPLTFSNQLQLDSFRLGSLLHGDSTLQISGYTKSNLTIDQSFIEGNVEGKQVLLQKKSVEYLLDTLTFNALVSPAKTSIEYVTDYAKVNLLLNFDIRDVSEVIGNWSEEVFTSPYKKNQTTKNRTARINLDLENANFIKLLGVDVEDFSSLKIIGDFDEKMQTSIIEAASGKFNGYGVSLDTMNTHLKVLRDSISLSIDMKNLFYDSIKLGNLEFNLLTQGDTAVSNLQLLSDSITTLGLQTRILPTDIGTLLYADKLIAFDTEYTIDSTNPVLIKKDDLVFDDFIIAHDAMQISLNGNLNYFDVSLRNIDLTPLNFLLSPDTTLINKGHLTGQISYSMDKYFNLQANIDSLSIYNSAPVTITATSVGEGSQVPFEFQLTNPSNKIDLKGQYFPNNKEVDASLLLELNNLELFSFLVSSVVKDMKGTLKGETSILGPIQKPSLKGYLQFVDVGLTTVNPELTFNIEDDRITLDQSALSFNNFKLYDLEHHPLTIDGSIASQDYKSFLYDLHINSDQYALINHPDSTSGKLRGALVIDSDIKLKGNEKDTNIEAKLTIKNATDLTVVTSKGDIELLNAEGIIDFVDPALLLDTISLEPSGNFYDSLIASLPDFNLNSTVTIEDNAVFRVLIDEKSGDYLEASGGAHLELGYDRTGNLSLNGNYTIRKGVYRLSFYDLVKKNFVLVEGSSINWHGSPKNGDLNIKAVLTVESNSLGLIGHEIGENEKSIYKRSLDYQVGINITGTIETPIISFSLDLPQKEKANYTVLANKLDRLRQPEYASELNKQVFGLLVLGGFLPESSADVNSSVIATTALANSVNSLLASQLNRFASQYVKGVNIDVGIQSFSDYSAPGGKTQTAMDFRVSKSVLNERLSFEIGGDFDINTDQSGGNTGKNYRGDIAIIYDLTGNGDKKLKLFNNETYDIVYQEIRNTGISLIFIREFENKKKNRSQDK